MGSHDPGGARCGTPERAPCPTTVTAMTSVTRPKGPLPARVYWTRRLLLLGIVLAVAFGTTRLLPEGDAGPSAGPAARPAAGSPTAPQSPSLGPSAGPTPEAAAGGKARGRAAAPRSPRRTPLAQPEGTCADEDVTVAPAVQPPAVAGQDVTVLLEITSRTAAACYWEVSDDSVVLRLSSGDDRIWSSQDCPAAVPTEEVVVRRADSRRTASVPVVWSGQRSDSRCSRTTSWANPGWYHATAAALSGEPTDEQFELVAPVAPTITPTPSPDADDPKRKKKRRQRAGR